jgi:hypothetical protein
LHPSGALGAQKKKSAYKDHFLTSPEDRMMEYSLRDESGDLSGERRAYL